MTTCSAYVYSRTALRLLSYLGVLLALLLMWLHFGKAEVPFVYNAF